MSKWIFLAFIPVLLWLSACDRQGKEGVSLRTSSGFPYVFHEKRIGPAPESGDKIRFFLSIYHNGVRIAEEDMTGVLPDTAGLPKPKPDIELLHCLSPMDSASVLVFGDRLSLLDMQGLQAGDTVRYAIRFVEVVRKREDHQYLTSRDAEASALLRETLKAYNDRNLGEDLQKRPSGLEYVIHDRGEGRFPMHEESVTVHYVGTLLDGTMFDNSFQRGAPFSFVLGVSQVIPGWDEGVRLLKENGYATIILPARLAYGPEGVPPAIPPNATIAFFIELREIQAKPEQSPF
jgi:FKBP-type peptidyl-prolyl cis-trans isomerase